MADSNPEGFLSLDDGSKWRLDDVKSFLTDLKAQTADYRELRHTLDRINEILPPLNESNRQKAARMAAITEIDSLRAYRCDAIAMRASLFFYR